MPQIRPATTPAARNEARDSDSGSRHAAALAARRTLLSDRPAVTTPNRPNATAIHRVNPGWLKAALISAPRLPYTPVVRLTERALTNPEANPAMPTARSSNGTKNRNRRNAIALPKTDPADSRSRR